MLAVLCPSAAKQFPGEGGMPALEEVGAVVGNRQSVEQHQSREHGDVIVGYVAFRSAPNREYVPGERVAMPLVNSFNRHAHSVIDHERDLV